MSTAAMTPTHEATEETKMEAESVMTPGIDDATLAKMRKHDQINLRQSDGVDTLGIYFEIDHDRYERGEVTHTLRVLFVAGHPIVQYKSKTSRSAKWTQLAFQTKINTPSDMLDPLKIEESWSGLRAILQSSYLGSGTAIVRGKPMIIQLQASDLQTIKLGTDAPMIRYTAKAAYEKNYGKGV